MAGQGAKVEASEMNQVNNHHSRCGTTPAERARQLAGHFFRIQKLIETGESVIISEWMVKQRKIVQKGNFRIRNHTDFENMMMHYSYNDYWSSCISLILDGARFAWIWKNMRNCPEFRSHFIHAFSSNYQEDNHTNSSCLSTNVQTQKSISPLRVHFVILESALLVIDKMGSSLSNSFVSVRCELETALSWLSTLGGAFSALGDISADWAVEAARISFKQLKIAWKMNDPLIGSRCRLYMAISLLQRGSLREAKMIVKKEYRYALSLPEGLDPRLRRMCLGVWAKLQYAWTMRQKRTALLSLQNGTNGKCNKNFTKDDNSCQKISNGRLESCSS